MTSPSAMARTSRRHGVRSGAPPRRHRRGRWYPGRSRVAPAQVVELGDEVPTSMGATARIRRAAADRLRCVAGRPRSRASRSPRRRTFRAGGPTLHALVTLVVQQELEPVNQHTHTLACTYSGTGGPDDSGRRGAARGIAGGDPHRVLLRRGGHDEALPVEQRRDQAVGERTWPATPPRAGPVRPSTGPAAGRAPAGRGSPRRGRSPGRSGCGAVVGQRGEPEQQDRVHLDRPVAGTGGRRLGIGRWLRIAAGAGAPSGGAGRRGPALR